MPALDNILAALNNPKTPEQREIALVGVEMITMLLEKNLKYGSSATTPIQIFSKLDPIEGIHIRMDDKLKRIQTGAANEDEDPIYDLAGYCVLEIVARRHKK